MQHNRIIRFDIKSDDEDDYRLDKINKKILKKIHMKKLRKDIEEIAERFDGCASFTIHVNARGNA